MAVERELEIRDCSANNSSEIPSIESMENRRVLSNGINSKFTFKVSPTTKKVLVEESIKKSRFEEDILTLKEIATILILSPVAKTFGQKEQCVEYSQTLERAYVTLKVIDSNEENSTSSYHFIAEPEDHFYLSANMLISKIKELHYIKEENSFIEKEQPSSFYFGFNYKLGDLYTQYPLDKFYNNMSLKAMAKFSEKPNESMGLGVGYHFNEYVEFFVAKVWTDDHESVQRANLGRTAATTYGVSFNLTKALGWIGNRESY